MHSTRRSLLKALSGWMIAPALPAVPLISEAFSAHVGWRQAEPSQEVSKTPRSASLEIFPPEITSPEIDSLAPIHFKDCEDSPLAAWTRLPRVPLTHADLRWHYEWVLNERSACLAQRGSPYPQSEAYPMSFLPAIEAHLRHIRFATSALDCIHSGSALDFTYLGGSQPGQQRKVSPCLLFTTTPQPAALSTAPHLCPFYLLAHCYARKAARTFRIDSIATPTQSPPPPNQYLTSNPKF